MQTQVELAKQSIRFMKLMPPDAEMELTLLKGHLLVEELLTEILLLTIDMDNPVGIEIKPRMMFDQKLRLCWAKNSEEQSFLFWQALKQLNSIRNEMAHAVEPKGITEKIKNFTDLVLPNSGFGRESYEGRELLCSVSWLYIVLSAWLHKIKNSSDGTA